MIKHFRIKNNFLLSGLFFLVTLFSVGSSLVSCSDSEKIVTQTEEKIVYVDGNWMVVASKEVTVMTGESVTLNVSVGGEEELKPEYTCTSKDANIATVAVSEDNNSIIITGVADGSTAISIECPTNTKPLVATIPVTVKQNAIRILAIGNSFSQDAVEQYLYELAEAAGYELIIGNMYIGGCDLDKHWANFQSDAAAYEYRKIVKGEKVGKTGYKLSQGLADENWDYISLQQASGKSGKYETYTVLADLIAGIKERCPKAKLLWHQTWAYASSSTHESFPDYDSNQMTMYSSIVTAARQAMTNHTDLSLLIPSGTAIQNGRTSFLGEETVDGQKCWKLESLPKDKRDIYSRKTALIRQDCLIPVRVEYYDKMGKLHRRLEMSDIAKVEGFWVARKMHMTNVQTEHQTVLEIKNPTYNIPMEESKFNVTTLEKGRF